MEWLDKNLDHHFLEYGCDGMTTYPNAPAMVIVECPPVDGGRKEATDWLKCLSNVCHQVGALFVLDEVVTGFRYGPDGAMGYYGLMPQDVDLLALGKTFGNAYPVSALLGRGDVMELLAGVVGRGQVHWSGTFGGEPTGMALASAFLRQLSNNPPWSHLYEMGEFLIERWNALGLPWQLAGHPSRPVIWPTPDEQDEDWLDLRRHLLRSGHIFVSHPIYVCTETTRDDVKSLCWAARDWRDR
jgi:glutamate-1-semialdehyde aminotransferase